MAVELIQFLTALVIILIPGIWIAGTLPVARDRTERIVLGSCIGLALAVYLGSVVATFSLTAFYPLWALVAVGSMFARIKWPADKQESASASIPWLWLLLFIVAVTRYLGALPHEFPDGEYDPTFHLLLARKIQIAGHAISDWRPFEDAPLNYPIGSHLLLVIFSRISLLPLHTVYKDFMPALGVLTTAQMFVFARRASSDDSVALFSAAAYGLLALFGSIDYGRWGGLPNELGMLLFLCMLTVYIDSTSRFARVATMALLYSSVILVHNHVMLASGFIIVVLLVIQFFRTKEAIATWKILFLAVCIAAVLDSFFLIPYANKISMIHSTSVLSRSEPLIDASEIIGDLGFVSAFLALIGMTFYAAKIVPRCHPVVVCGAGATLGIFIVTRFVIPLLCQALNRPSVIFLAPTRFLTDANYFLPVFAGMALGLPHSRFRLNHSWIMALIALGALSNWTQWKDQWSGAIAFTQPHFVNACRWIQANTPRETIVMNSVNWTPYLSWRRTLHTPLPDSEVVTDRDITFRHAHAIMSGKSPPDSPDMQIVQIVPVSAVKDQPIVWKDSALAVVRLWPK